MSADARFWIAVLHHCFLAAEMDSGVIFSSRIDGLLLPGLPTEDFV